MAHTGCSKCQRRLNYPDSEERTDVLGTFARPKGVVRIDLGGSKEPIASSQTFYGLRLTPVGE